MNGFVLIVFDGFYQEAIHSGQSGWIANPAAEGYRRMILANCVLSPTVALRR